MPVDDGRLGQVVDEVRDERVADARASCALHRAVIDPIVCPTISPRRRPVPPDGDVARVLVDNRRAFLGFLERRLGRRDLAEDILQEVRARDALRRQVARSCGTCAEHGCVACTCGPKT